MGAGSRLSKLLSRFPSNLVKGSGRPSSGLSTLPIRLYLQDTVLLSRRIRFRANFVASVSTNHVSLHEENKPGLLALFAHARDRGPRPQPEPSPLPAQPGTEPRCPHHFCQDTRFPPPFCSSAVVSAAERRERKQNESTLNNWLHPAFASTSGRGWPVSFSSLTFQEVSRGTHFVLRFRGVFSSIQGESPWCRPVSQASSKNTFSSFALMITGNRKPVPSQSRKPTKQDVLIDYLRCNSEWLENAQSCVV